MHSIRNQLIVVFLLVIIVPTGIITALLYTQSSNMIYQNRGQTMVGELNHVSGLIDQSLSEVSLLLAKLSYDARFMSLIYAAQDADEVELERYCEELLTFMRDAQGYYSTILQSLYLYLEKPRVIVTSYANMRIVHMLDLEYYHWVEQPVPRNGTSEWFLTRAVPSSSSTEPVGISIMKKKAIHSVFASAPEQKVGEVSLVISSSSLKSMYLESLRNTGSDYILMYDRDQNLIASAGLKQQNLEMLPNESFLGEIDRSLGNGFFRHGAFGKDMQICYASSPGNGFTYVALIPVEEYMQGFAQVGMQGVIVAVLCCIFAVFVSLWYSMRFYHPIHMLRDTMLLAERGDMGVRMRYHRKDEFTQLSDGFNAMIRRIARLMEDLSNEKLLHKEAELRNLQTQVNPHFLYNVLDTMHWMARLKKTEELAGLTRSLASFYRATLSEGKKTVTVRESIDMIREYLNILSARYGDHFTAHFDLDEKLMDEKVLHLVLQPIVENAMYHSIEQVLRHANLYIRVFEENGDLFMSIEDDGVGIDAEMLKRLIASFGDEDGQPEGFALRNIHMRLKLFYGEGYGLTIHSTIGVGTTVIAKMAKIR